MKILHLTLKKKWFDMIASGEKREEYRDPSQWIRSRLINRTYNIVRFRNGYSPTSPVMDFEYLGSAMGTGQEKWGAVPGKIYYVIRLGKVLTPPAEIAQASRLIERGLLLKKIENFIAGLRAEAEDKK